MESSPIKFAEWVRPSTESEFVRALRGTPVLVWCWIPSCLPPLPVESMLPYLSTYAQPRNLCKTWLLAQSTPGSAEPVVLDDSDALFSVPSGILDTTKVDPTEINGRMDCRSHGLVFLFLARYSRTRRSRGPPLDSVLEEYARINQQDPTRSPHYHSRLLGHGPQRPRPDRPNSRLPSLETGVHMVLLFVDRFRVSEVERGQSSRLPRTFKVLPHQPAARPGR
jgi:hypothetical protein